MLTKMLSYLKSRLNRWWLKRTNEEFEVWSKRKLSEAIRNKIWKQWHRVPRKLKFIEDFNVNKRAIILRDESDWVRRKGEIREYMRVRGERIDKVLISILSPYFWKFVKSTRWIWFSWYRFILDRTAIINQINRGFEHQYTMYPVIAKSRKLDLVFVFWRFVSAIKSVDLVAIILVVIFFFLGFTFSGWQFRVDNTVWVDYDNFFLLYVSCSLVLYGFGWLMELVSKTRNKAVDLVLDYVPRYFKDKLALGYFARANLYQSIFFVAIALCSISILYWYLWFFYSTYGTLATTVLMRFYDWASFPPEFLRRWRPVPKRWHKTRPKVWQKWLIIARQQLPEYWAMRPYFRSLYWRTSSFDRKDDFFLLRFHFDHEMVRKGKPFYSDFKWETKKQFKKWMKRFGGDLVAQQPKNHYRYNYNTMEVIFKYLKAGWLVDDALVTSVYSLYIKTVNARSANLEMFANHLYKTRGFFGGNDHHTVDNVLTFWSDKYNLLEEWRARRLPTWYFKPMKFTARRMKWWVLYVHRWEIARDTTYDWGYWRYGEHRPHSRYRSYKRFYYKLKKELQTLTYKRRTKKNRRILMLKIKIIRHCMKAIAPVAFWKPITTRWVNDPLVFFYKPWNIYGNHRHLIPLAVPKRVLYHPANANFEPRLLRTTVIEYKKTVGGLMYFYKWYGSTGLRREPYHYVGPKSFRDF